MRPIIVLSALLLTLTTACGTARNEESPITGGSSSALVATAVYGIVRTPDGQPAVGVVVSATSLDEPARAIPELAVVTDDQGTYEWPLRPGRYRLSAGASNGVLTHIEFTVNDGVRYRADIDLKD